MKRLLVYLLIFLAAVWLGVTIQKDSGYVLVSYANWSLETTLWFAVLSLLLVFFMLSLLLRFLSGLMHFSGSFRLWNRSRQIRKSRNQTSQGLCELAEGDWKRAEKNLVQAAPNSETPLINYLAAAHAAQKQQAFTKRDRYLQQAHQSTPDSEVAVGLSQAQQQLEAKQLEQALATLRHLKELVPGHALVLQLLAETYVKLQDWQELHKLLPLLRKHKVLNPKQYEQLVAQVYPELLPQIAKTGDKRKLELTWEEMSKDIKQQPAVLLAYSKALMLIHEEPKAEELLRQYLKKNWDINVVQQYGLLYGSNPAKQLAAAENWLKNHPHNPMVLLCLGRLCARNRLWGKARSYLAASVQFDPKPTTYFELAKSLEAMGEQAAALDAYRKGLELCVL